MSGLDEYQDYVYRVDVTDNNNITIGTKETVKTYCSGKGLECLGGTLCDGCKGEGICSETGWTHGAITSGHFTGAPVHVGIHESCDLTAYTAVGCARCGYDFSVGGYGATFFKCYAHDAWCWLPAGGNADWSSDGLLQRHWCKKCNGKRRNGMRCARKGPQP